MRQRCQEIHYIPRQTRLPLPKSQQLLIHGQVTPTFILDERIIGEL
jgi:hypothetical protein